jgi:hypothetical protein
MKKLAAFALVALMAAPALTAQMGVPTESMGGRLKSPEEKSLDAYARGVKAMKKAKGETDHDKQMKLYTRAKDEFSKSVGYTGHFDGYLALGRVLEAQKAPESSEAKPAGGQ